MIALPVGCQWWFALACAYTVLYVTSWYRPFSFSRVNMTSNTWNQEPFDLLNDDIDRSILGSGSRESLERVTEEDGCTVRVEVANPMPEHVRVHSHLRLNLLREFFAKQECIPVGWVPTAGVTATRCQYRGRSAKDDICPTPSPPWTEWHSQQWVVLH